MFCNDCCFKGNITIYSIESKFRKVTKIGNLAHVHGMMLEYNLELFS